VGTRRKEKTEGKADEDSSTPSFSLLWEALKRGQGSEKNRSGEKGKGSLEIIWTPTSTRTKKEKKKGGEPVGNRSLAKGKLTKPKICRTTGERFVSRIGRGVSKTPEEGKGWENSIRLPSIYNHARKEHVSVAKNWK